MGLNYSKVKNSKDFEILTGLTRQDFDNRLEGDRSRPETQLNEMPVESATRLQGVADKLLFVLTYLHLRPTPRAQSLLFDLTPEQAEECIAWIDERAQSDQAEETSSLQRLIQELYQPKNPVSLEELLTVNPSLRKFIYSTSLFQRVKHFFEDSDFTQWPQERASWKSEIFFSLSLFLLGVLIFQAQKAFYGNRFENWQQSANQASKIDLFFNYEASLELLYVDLYQEILKSEEFSSFLEDVVILEQSALDTNRESLESIQSDLQFLSTSDQTNNDLDDVVDPKIGSILTRLDIVIRRYDRLYDLDERIDIIAALRDEALRKDRLFFLQLCSIFLRDTSSGLGDLLNSDGETPEAQPQTQSEETNNQPELQGSSLSLPKKCQNSSDLNKKISDSFKDEVITIVLAANLDDATEGQKIQLVQQSNHAKEKSAQAFTRSQYYYSNLFACFWMVLPLGVFTSFLLFKINEDGWKDSNQNLRAMFFTASASLFLVIQVPLLFSYEDNFLLHRDLYLQYEQINSDINAFFVTSLVKSEAGKVGGDTTVSRNKQVATPEDFIFFIERNLEAINAISLDARLDKTALPNYSLFFEPFNGSSQTESSTADTEQSDEAQGSGSSGQEQPPLPQPQTQ